ncbi:START domain [Trypanosoma melophagium]|uniref:START domain n=1 Tax=Trypanosoma melophagium TaxID=715481 RepID=UPI00351A39F8|nr:START domain [Trypanosoma melophagium]
MAYLAQSPAEASLLNASVHTKHVPENDDDLYRKAVDFTDVERILLATAEESGFRCITQDTTCDITLYSRPVENCPVHLMRAEAFLPCPPTQVLAYLDVPTRREWDDHIAELRSLRTLQRPRSLVKESNSDMKDVVGETEHRLRVLQPGQRRVALHYMAIRSPIPLVQNRDFELVVSEEVRRDGTAWVKAFSTPLGYIEPLDPKQSKYVRGLMLFSGVLAKPMINAEGQEKCRLSYVALVHPMGLIPSVLVNMVLGAQLSALRKLQKFISLHPLPTLCVEFETHAKEMCNDDKTTSGSSSSSSGNNHNENNTRGKAKRGKMGQKITTDLSKKSRSVMEREKEDSVNQEKGVIATTTRRRRTDEVRRRISSLKAGMVDWLLSNL